MIYSENLTNKELLLNAMSLSSLSREQWNIIVRHVNNVEQLEGSDSELLKALELLVTNQSKMEITNNYFDCYMRELNDPVREQSVLISVLH